MKTLIKYILLIVLVSLQLFSQPVLRRIGSDIQSMNIHSSSRIGDNIYFGTDWGYFLKLDSEGKLSIVDKSENSDIDKQFAMIEAMDGSFAAGSASSLLGFNNDKWDYLPFDEKIIFSAIRITNSSGILAAGSPGFIYRSENEGLSWQKIKLNTNSWIYDIREYKDTLFLLGENGMLIKSHDSFQTNEGISNVTDGAITRAYFDEDIRVLFTNSGKIYTSTDDGINYIEVFSDSTYSFRDYAILNGKIVAVGAKGKILISEIPSIQWKEVDLGFDIYFSTIIVDGDDFLIGGDNTHVIRYNESKIEKLNAKTNIDFYCVSISENVLLGGSRNGVIYASYNQGQNWQEIFNAGDGYICGFAKHQDGRNYFATSSGKLYMETTDLNFEQQDINIGNDAFTSITSFEEYLYLGTKNGNIYSNHLNNTWNIIYESNDSSSVTDIYFNKSGNFGLATTIRGNKLLFTEDGGNTWKMVDPGFDSPLTCAYEEDGSWIIAGMYGQIAFSNDGFNWNSKIVKIDDENKSVTDIIAFKDIIDSELRFIATTIKGDVIYSDANGESWKTLDKYFSPLLEIEYNNSEFLIAGFNGYFAIGDFPISSIISNNYIDDIKLFPQPTKDYLLVENYNESIFIFELSIYNYIGEELFHKSNRELKNSLNLDLSLFSTGSYILNMKTNFGIISKKFVVNK